MITGHFAAAVFARGRVGAIGIISMGVASYLADILELGARLIGQSPTWAQEYSHSTLTLLIFGSIAALAVRISGHSSKAALVVLALVMSHAPLDWITGRDKPLAWAFGPRVGLGLYARPLWDAALESGMCVIAWMDCQRRGQWCSARGRWLMIASVVVVQMFYVTYEMNREFRRAVRRTIRPAMREIPGLSRILLAPGAAEPTSCRVAT